MKLFAFLLILAVGICHGTKLGDEDNRLDGVLARGKPAKNPEELTDGKIPVNKDEIQNQPRFDRGNIGAKKGPKSTDKAERGQLANSPQCQKEIDFYCPHVLLSSDILVLECLINKVNGNAELSDGCDTLLHQYKVDMTTDDRFTPAAEKFCSSEPIFTGKCSKAKRRSNEALLKCLIDNKAEMSESGQCRSFMTRVETVVFADWELVKPFLQACDGDIKKFECGSVKPVVTTDRINHSQRATLDCLVKVVVDKTSNNGLTRDCRQQVLRIAELQSDDFHLNRPLFLACRDDRERFCPTVVAGDGRVLACLMKNIHSGKMSAECSIQLAVEQQLIGQDYKISHVLVKSCSKPMKQYGCEAPEGANQDQFYLSYVILCLENAVRFGNHSTKLPGECAAEILDLRKALMSDYRMNPEVVTSCRFEIQKLCANLDAGGQTIHCLMSAVANGRINTQECIRSVQHLMKVREVKC